MVERPKLTRLCAGPTNETPACVTWRWQKPFPEPETNGRLCLAADERAVSGWRRGALTPVTWGRRDAVPRDERQSYA